MVVNKNQGADGEDSQIYILLLTPAKTSPCLLNSQVDRHRTSDADWLSGVSSSEGFTLAGQGGGQLVVVDAVVAFSCVQPSLHPSRRMTSTPAN